MQSVVVMKKKTSLLLATKVPGEQCILSSLSWLLPSWQPPPTDGTVATSASGPTMTALSSLVHRTASYCEREERKKVGGRGMLCFGGLSVVGVGV